MNRIISYTLILWFSGMMTVLAQNTAFDSFISRMAQQYKVDIALSPELVPSVDSIINSGTTITSVEELLRLLVKQEHLTYQIVDGNKLMLRRDTDPVITASALTIEGNILDQKDGLPLSYAVVRIINSTRGCQSDEQGHFQMPVSDTTSMLEVDYLGYTPVKIPARRFMEGPVTIRMKMQEVPLEEVTIVVPYKEIARDPGTQALNLSGYQLISGDQLLQWNIDRLINTLTGYTQFSSDEGIRIRGVEPENSLFLMDGLPVYSPYHFYNIFSPFNGQYFSSVKIYKNNLPVAYGGRVDGMIQLESDTKSQKDLLVLESDLLLSSLAAKVNIAKNFTASVAGRISHTRILNEALTDSSVTNFKVPGKFKDNNEWTSVNEPRSNFYDLNAGISGQINPGLRTYVNFFTSRDTLRNTTNSSLETSYFNHEVVAVEQTLVTRDEWKNLGASAGMELQLGSQTALVVDAFSSKYEKESYYESNFDELEHGSHHRMENTGLQYDRLNNSGLKSYVEKSLFGGAGYQFGIDLNRYKVNLNATENETPYVSQVQHEFETTLFGSYQAHVFNHFLMTAGARVTHLDRTSKVYLLPNFKANYYIGSFFHIRAAYS
ncbi:MAG TPA: carboxypeptidase-like regulatory domain-containing protein, partial [Saprospiraceae bacterium]|nr:carboxypeptidase-like regulatory domain-containing protein [Saprospiraceae bacterium]